MGHNSPTSWAFLVPPTSPRLPQEQRKHFDESDAAAARDAAAAERLGHQDEDGLSLSSPSSSMSHKRTGASQPSPTSPHGASRSTAAQDAVAPNTPTDPREARGPPREVRAPSAPSSGSRGGSRQSYGLAPSSGSGLSISPETSPHQDGQISANPFGIDSTPSSPRVAGAKSDQDERPDTRPSRGSTGGAEMTVAKILSNQAETGRAPEPKTVAQSRSTRDEAADVAEAVEAGVDHALQADDLGDLAVGAKGDQRRDEGRKGQHMTCEAKLENEAAFASAALAAVGGRIAVGMRLGHPGAVLVEKELEKGVVWAKAQGPKSPRALGLRRLARCGTRPVE
ncbi:unnamed protein product [Durusdinium trenchii]|uniref:Uncharacterized protein n=1 Tax=Durusdinium trenchii TaxID=1381693 RepID=A0ABP0L4S4_9DINO